MSTRHRHPQKESIHYRCRFGPSSTAPCLLYVAASTVPGCHLGWPDRESRFIGRVDTFFVEDFERPDNPGHVHGKGCLSAADHIAVNDCVQSRAPVKP